MFVYQFLSHVMEISLGEAKREWDQAKPRLARRGLELPATTREKPPGARQPTPKIEVAYAARALRLILKEPLSFFEDAAKLLRLKEALVAEGADPAAADVELAALQAEKNQREVDARSLVLPTLHSGVPAIALRTTRGAGEVLGSVLDYLRWLGVEDADGHTWRDGLRDAFCQPRDLAEDDALGKAHGDLVLEEMQLPGYSLRTPMTNFAGFRRLTLLCLRKSKIAWSVADSALTIMGRVEVGDQRIYAEVDANAAGSSSDARAFVLGPQEAARQGQAVLTSSPTWMPLLVRDLQPCLQDMMARALASALPVALRSVQLSPDAVQVNINSSGRSNADLRSINLPPPESEEEEARALASDTLLVSVFLKRKFAEVRADGVVLSAVTQARAVKGVLGNFSSALKVAKARAMGAVPVPYAGQIGRAQVHYRYSDRPLMERVWTETEPFRALLVTRLQRELAAAAEEESVGRPRARSRSARAAAVASAGA
jgi:hypothetical protein